jgi:hypothetical protein
MANESLLDRRGNAVPAPTRAATIDDALFVACGLAWCAGLIHAVAAVGHVDEYLPAAVFFSFLAPAQAALGTALYRHASRNLLLAGAVGSALVVALWVVSRTSGLPVGPHPWVAEAVGPLDVIASADEVLLALLACLQLAGARGRRVRRSFRLPLLGAGAGLILLSLLALTAGRHLH